MFPVIWAGDCMKIEPVNPKDLSIGDIVFYKTAGLAYAHRLIDTCRKNNTLYLRTGGEMEYRNRDRRVLYDGGISAESVLGRVVEVRRGGLCFKPDDRRVGFMDLIEGRIRFALWSLIQGMRHKASSVFISLQRSRLYRLFLRRIIAKRISFFVGTSLVSNNSEIHNLCAYQQFKDSAEDCESNQTMYVVSARINNYSVGNISLFFDVENTSGKICTLANCIVRIPFRGCGIGQLLLEKSLSLCERTAVAEVNIFLSKRDIIALDLFRKFGFEIEGKE
jgi:ribosomal protein S18 acetylase RimI-like enzyme